MRAAQPEEPLVDTLTPEQQQAMWNEVAAERAGSTATTPPNPEPAPESAPESDVKDNATAPAAAEPENNGADPEPPPKADPLAEAIATLTAKIDKLEGRQRSVDGHIGSLTAQQRALNDKMLGQLAAGREAANKVDNAPTAAQIAEAVKNPKEWEDLKEEYPTWANATEKFFEARLASLKTPSPIDPARIDQIVSEKLKGQTESMRREIAETALEAVMPDWKHEINSQAFADWMQSQPDNIKALVYSESVGDAARMLKLFDDARRASPAARLTETRKQTLAQAVSPPRGKPVPKQKTPDQMSDQELWDYEAAQRAKERQQRGY
jgi:hypothetical protein